VTRRTRARRRRAWYFAGDFADNPMDPRPVPFLGYLASAIVVEGLKLAPSKRVLLEVLRAHDGNDLERRGGVAMSRRRSYDAAIGARTDAASPSRLVLLGLVVVAARGPSAPGPPRDRHQPAAKAIGARDAGDRHRSGSPRGLTGVKVEFVQGDRTETLVTKTYTPESAWAFGGPRTEQRRDPLRARAGRSEESQTAPRDDPRHRDPGRKLAAPPGSRRQGDRPPR
jgi:hypothetical protein